MSSELDPRNEDSAIKHPRIQSRKVFYKGQTIFKQGEPAHCAYYIESGFVEVSVEKQGYNVKISEQGRGSIIGELALISPAPRSATVTALDDCSVVQISKQDLESKIMAIDNKATQALFYLLIDRIRAGNEGQAEHYINFAQFQERIGGLVSKVTNGVDEAKREAFSNEVSPILDMLDSVLKKYKS
jgi:CRP-like cAMP-binding protein